MKALTLWQPWASLMARGFKKVETRSWTTKYRGEVAIHAAKKIPHDYLGFSRHLPVFDKQYRLTKLPYFSDLPTGAILAIATLVEVVLTEDASPDLSAMELAFGNYDEGRYAWFFENVKPLAHTVPVKGNRMLWNWSE